MHKTALTLALSGLWALTATAQAADDNAALKKQLEKIGATNVQISDSPLPNFKVASSDEGLVYISNDGKYVIQGKIYELKAGGAVDITNQALLGELNALSGEMIVYPAKNQKHIVTVFMDITCHYCQVLHSKMQEYNDLGITVRYLAFPRAGLNTQTARQMEAIWAEKDRNHALNQAEQGNLPKTLKDPNIVRKHYQLGIKFGVTGTPNIVTSSGELIAGYVEPKALLAMLNGQ